MTKARDLANIISGGFTESDIPNLSASKITSGSLADARIPNLATSKITSGTFADARLSQSSVQQYASTFDDNKIVNDISTLAIRQASNENKSAYNTNSMYVDVFQDDTGIASNTNAPRNANEYVSSATISAGTPAWETGDKSSVYTITVDDNNKYLDGTGSGSPINNWINGNTTADGNNAWYFADNTVDNTRFIRFDLGSGNRKIFQGVREYTNNTNGLNGNWIIRASNDATSWTNLKDSFVWQCGFGANPGSHTWSNSTSYRYIEFRGVSGTDTSQGWHSELEFYVAPEVSQTNATGNFTGTTITAPSSVSSMGAIITYQDNAGTNTLNTDIILKLSADGGSNYATATMTAMPDFASGIKMAKVNDLSVTAGTSLKYKIEFANQSSGSKEARIRGVSLQY